jgi:hypothetical protein
MPVGFVVQPARWRRRLPTSMKNSTETRRSEIVSTVQKSQVDVVVPCR